MSRRLNETDMLWLAMLPAAVLGIGAISLASAYWARRERRKARSLRSNLSHLMHQLHSYAVANDENFPLRLGKLIDDGYIPWLPDNPYTGGPMPEIEPGMPQVPGGLTYLPWRDRSSGEIVAASLLGYGRSPQLRRAALPPLPGLPANLPWAYCVYAETTGFLPESPDDLEPAV